MARKSKSTVAAFDKVNLKDITQAVRTALTSVEKEFGIVFDLKPGTFTAQSFNTKLSAIVAQTDKKGKVLSTEAVAFKQHAKSYGMKPTWLKKKFELNGTKYMVAGLNTRARKNPVLIQDKQGKRYVASPTLIINKLSKK